MTDPDAGTFDHSVLGTREHLSLGLDTFGDAPLDGAPGNHAETLREVVAEAVLADRVGVDYIGLGEHHRPDYAISAPDVVLAAIAGQTERIRLGTGVTVLSSDDPIRVYERFATLDAVSNGRAEVQLGRGSFIESFGLFGLDLGDYDRLFEEKLDLFAALQHEQPVTWEGRHPYAAGRPAGLPDDRGRQGARVDRRRWHAAVGRAGARYGMPLMLAVIGGSPSAFVPFADLYRDALGQLDLPELPIGMHSPGHVAATDEEAREQLFPHQAELVTRIGRERGWGPYSRIAFEQRASPQGALFVGSPETVAQKIAWAARTLGPLALPAEVLRRRAAARAAARVDPALRRGSHPASSWLLALLGLPHAHLHPAIAVGRRPARPARQRRRVPAAPGRRRDRGAGRCGCSAGRCASSRAATRSTSRRVVLAGVWAVGAFLSGRLHLGRMARSNEVFVRPILAPILLGLLLVGVFVARLARRARDPAAGDYVSSVLEYADEGSLTAAGGHHVRQRHRRGAVLPRRDVRRDPEAPGALDDAGLRRRDARHRQRDAGLRRDPARRGVRPRAAGERRRSSRRS